jgi:hypothetical protein
MNRRIVATVVAGLIIGMTAFGASAQADRPAPKSDRGMQGMQGKSGKDAEKGKMDSCESMMHGGMMGGMMGGGMMGRGGMGGMMGGGMMPQLPPGNEKLQVQMHAEIMQKVGEIVAKYAAQAK